MRDNRISYCPFKCICMCVWSVPCTKPMDLLFLLRASSDNQFEDLKTFVKTFVKNTQISKSQEWKSHHIYTLYNGSFGSADVYVCTCDLGHNDTQVAVMVYGAKPAVAISWKDEQNKDNLLKLMDNLHRKADNTSRLGKCATQRAHCLTV